MGSCCEASYTISLSASTSAPDYRSLRATVWPNTATAPTRNFAHPSHTRIPRPVVYAGSRTLSTDAAMGSCPGTSSRSTGLCAQPILRAERFEGTVVRTGFGGLFNIKVLHIFSLSKNHTKIKMVMIWHIKITLTDTTCL